MRRRLDLIASVVARPVLFLDEPTTGLDPRSRTEIWSTVRERLVAAGTTVLLTTQYLEEADRLADDIVIVDAGRAVATGTPDTLKAAMWCAGRGGRRGAGGPRFCRGGA
jgi:ABC-2 type transport system ATP-binding protein